MNLTLEITQNGFIVRYFGKKYLTFDKTMIDAFKGVYPYEARHAVYNWKQCEYITDKHFKWVISSLLNNAQASRLFWRVINEYTNFGE